jgi:flagellar biosynthetic protein FliQ
MTTDYVITVLQQAFWISFLISAPFLALTLIAGLAVSILQAVTQVHEATLTFIPKIIAVIIALFIFGPWILNSLVNYTAGIFINLPAMVR